MIEAQHLTKVYGDTTALQDVSFSVGKGEILGFLGPNGAGKTTTMRILTCYTPATSGAAKVAGFDVRSQSLEVRRRLGYLPESVPLYGEMTVRGYLSFIAEVKGHRGGKRKKAVDQSIEECGLGTVKERLINHISRGFKQRVGLAQAVLGDPEVLILDEPTIGLDPKQIADIRELIKNMAGRRTVILSSHILPEVSMTCQKVLIINRGRIVATGTPAEMVSSLERSNQTDLLVRGGAAEVESLLTQVPGVKKVKREGTTNGANEFLVDYDKAKDPRAEIARSLAGAGHDLLEMRTRGLSLEDVFIRIVSGEEGKNA